MEARKLKEQEDAADAFFPRGTKVCHPQRSLILFHMARTSDSGLPILIEITRQENRDFSSDFREQSFCFSSIVQVSGGLGEREVVLSARRRRLVGALGVAFSLGLRLAGVAVGAENFDGSGKSSGDGAAT